MDVRPRSAQKRRQHAAASDESDDSNEDDWTAPSEASRSASSGTSGQVDTLSDSSNHVNFQSGLSEEPHPLQRTPFSSWESFHAFLNEYSAQTYQSFRVRTNNKVEERNKKIKKASSRAPLIPLEWGMYNKTLVCTHAGTFKSRGKGKRARQESRATRCGAQINACIRVINNKPDDPEFALCVTTAKLAHNHRLDRMTHQQYASVRTALPTRVVDTVDILRKAGAKKKRILEYILENADNSVEIRDVHNLVRKLKERETAETTSKVRMKTWLTEFREEPGNIGRIFVGNRGDKV
ncbi:hypothetical protein PInf_004514 [Phytophthora infestans]|nr:hypothetical protein PInf_004514 [Phytophthora infestans]